MSYPVEVASVLTGASVSQLRRWSRTDLLVPEAGQRPVLYSFRDLVALRTVAHLRQSSSLQQIRRALRGLQAIDLTDHPSRYKLVSTGDTIVVVDEQGATDLVKKPGQLVVATLEDIFAPFVKRDGGEVVDFRRPLGHLEVRERRLSGWPTIAGTRVPYNTVADLTSDGTIPLDQVSYYYPGVDAAAARGALRFAEMVTDARPRDHAA